LGWLHKDTLGLTVESVCCVRYVWFHNTRKHSATVRAGKMSCHSNGSGRTTCRYVQQVCCIGQPAKFFFLNPCF